MAQLRVRVMLTVERIVEFNNVDEADEDALVEDAKQGAAEDLELNTDFEVSDRDAMVSWAGND